MKLTSQTMKPFQNPLQAAAIAAVFLVAIAFSANATLITYDGFNYASGTNLHGLSGGTGWQTAWDNQNGTGSAITVASSGLTYSTLITSGNQVTTNTYDSTGRRLDVSYLGAWDSAGYVSDPFIITQIDQGTVWGSFLARRNAATATWDEPVFSLHRNNTDWFATSASSALQIGWDATGGTWFARQGSTTTNLAGSAIGEVVLFAFKLELSTSGTNNIYVWMNPSGLGGSDLAVSTANASFTGLATSDARFKAFAVYGGGSASNAMTFDEVRFGTTYASVTPIPEPAAALLATVGLFVILLARRRRI